ncbi:hypothetical protein GCM10023321_18960 [Pseudonocardia eucalypti]|uniref:DUF559 domain-containing protein n=1 Tax=Pseudonocardia eucalypti TaxID=648755 RepID=A0ABP9PX10_9PSEU
MRGSAYHRVWPDVYLPAAVVLDLEARSRAAYLWARRWGGVLGGYSACALLGADCPPRDAPAEIVVTTSHLRAPRGIRLRQDDLAAHECREVRGVEVTTPLRTAYDLARRGSLEDAVVAVDELAGRFHFAPEELLVMAERHAGARGCRRLPEVVELAEPRAESVMETRLRLVLVLAGLPRPVVQHRVRDRSGRLVATEDLAYPEHRIALEYEGHEHFTPERSARDAYRYTRLQDLGWRVYRYSRRDVFRRPTEIVAEIERALARPP